MPAARQESFAYNRRRMVLSRGGGIEIRDCVDSVGIVDLESQNADEFGLSSRTPNQSVLVIVPTYCERENVTVLTDGLIRACPSADLLFIDDNSPDGTGQVLDDLAASREQLHVLHRPRKTGLGRAYVAGFRWAVERGYSLVVAMDADLSHQPGDVPRLLAAAEHADLVLGSRYVGGATVGKWALSRALLSHAARAYAKIITGLPFSDPTGGFRCYRGEVLRSLDVDCVTSKGFAFQVEMVHHVWLAGFRIVDAPITFEERRAGRSKIGWAIAFEGAWKIWCLLLRARFRRRPRERSAQATIQRRT